MNKSSSDKPAARTAADGDLGDAAELSEPAALTPSQPFLHSRGASWFELSLATLLAMVILLPGLWSYTLVDPWETHYAEVARHMLEGHDFVHTKWQDEGFRSKPVLTFWMIAGGLRALGLGADGGFSGEMVSSPMVMFAVRLPFALFAVLGLVMTFWMLSRLVSRRTAWLGLLVTSTTPFFLLVGRQAITDIPMVACLMGSLACFAMAVHAGDSPLRAIARIRGREINAFHLFLAVLVALIGWQLAYYAYYFAAYPKLAAGIRVPVPYLLLPGGMLLGLVGFLVWSIRISPTRYARQVYMYWFYALLAVSVLGKGLPGIGLAGLVCFFYLLLTGQWRLLAKVEIPRGILLCLLIAVPWHLAMLFKDGRPFLRDYFLIHLWRRAAFGVHGERGTFNFFLSQIGIGMWPWVALLPAAVGDILSRITGRTRAGGVRLLIAIWAVVSVGFFVAVQTKFHHYILPAVPALALLVAFWLDDVLAGRVRNVTIAALAGAAIALLLARDLMGEQKQLIELFIYRYDRPWPSGAPWFVDASDAFLGFGLAFAGSLLAFAFPRLRRVGMLALGTSALVFALWVSNVYMHHAATHWGMREAIQSYYQQRQIHGIDIRYHGARQIADEWDGHDGSFLIRSLIPDHLSVGQPMSVRVELAETGGEVQVERELHGTVERIAAAENRFWVALAPEELAKLDELVARGRGESEPEQRPQRQVNADRLIAWQLYWRGENFWSGGEIWGPFAATKTAFKDTDNKAFLQYLNTEGIPGQRYYLVTEAGRASGLRGVLPTPQAKDSFEILNTSSNKFTLLSFVL
ncbi:ArnT family glycosyltransferase [Haliangium ochraceum]|uniref:4-amino-4-deoxy-L-arabinose transferase and related glycosyltransferase of PMT family-like protein n=1 Tax=Haliangium ochraceum (strain DSM 14365 / JCM 11303 / SMP-2) TaxID=502025 RepID=D0LG83_HALO1|nr:4-amino-4-deoxy-L-arabinose transferase-like protein [Haliangium ochraceum]ACY18108.1 4-amino-4-deoxy-L-arabinose transferase and related glycosyltransferase of PMT family-like protein [Haliangium ochraceum DSM 14365]